MAAAQVPAMPQRRTWGRKRENQAREDSQELRREAGFSEDIFN